MEAIAAINNLLRYAKQLLDDPPEDADVQIATVIDVLARIQPRITSALYDLRKASTTKIDGFDAITVNDFEEVVADGNLYYVAPNNHFAVRIAGELFHGNIGTTSADKSRTADCQYNPCKHRATCKYYHDPKKYSDSVDCRNYMPAAWVREPEQQSNDVLANQIMHLMLCSLR